MVKHNYRTGTVSVEIANLYDSLNYTLFSKLK